MRLFVTIIEVIVLTAIGTGIGFGANWMRGTDQTIILNKAYARPPAVLELPLSPNPDAANDADSHTDVATTTPIASNHVEHEFTAITTDEIFELLYSPDTQNFLNIIIDARDDDHFTEGHIPGAMQFYPYQPDRFMDKIEPYVTAAEKVIVYCAGGECSDSVMMCRSFESDMGILRDRIFLYEGGWNEWTKRNMPVDTGMEE